MSPWERRARRRRRGPGPQRPTHEELAATGEWRLLPNGGAVLLVRGEPFLVSDRARRLPLPSLLEAAERQLGLSLAPLVELPCTWPQARERRWVVVTELPD